jgi:hypothetical protein
MDLGYFGYIIANLVLYSWYLKYLILPTIGIVTIIRVLTIKHKLKIAGTNDYRIIIKDNCDDNKKSQYLFVSIGIIVFAFSLIFSQHLLIYIILGGFIIWLSGDIIKNKIFGNIRGIYENGIVDENNLIRWDKIHSYTVNENSISGFFKNGFSFEYNNLDNIIVMKELFERKKITERK